MLEINEHEQPGSYFDSYDNISVHNLMLRDDPRVSKYKEAILNSKDLFRGKVVLDVGSGTSVLSLFCAQAGAKHVYAVEACKGIYELSKAIVDANNLTDKVTIINGEIEKIELPDDLNEVDIIVSEWMGVYLLHESMLGSVIFAREKWLRKDGKGLMYPYAAYLYVAPVEMSEYLETNLKYWSNYHDLNFEPMMKVYRKFLLEKPIVENLKKSQLIDDEQIFASLDLLSIKQEDLETFQSYNLKFVSQKSDCNLHGFAFWFDVIFNTDKDIVTLSTSPNEPQTHWKQTIAFIPSALDFLDNNDSNNNAQIKEETSDMNLNLKENDLFSCYIILNQSETNHRQYTIDIGVDLENEKKSETSDEDIDEDDHIVPCDCGAMKCLIIKATIEKYEKEKLHDTNQ